MQLRAEEVVFTRHARERLEQRKISEQMIINAIAMPYRSFTQKDGGMKFICRINERNVHVVCQPLPEERKWLVITVWVRGEDDNGKVVKRAKNKKALSFNIMVILIILISLAIAFLFFYLTGF